jgi:hypothetical protein
MAIPTEFFQEKRFCPEKRTAPSVNPRWFSRPGRAGGGSTAPFPVAAKPRPSATGNKAKKRWMQSTAGLRRWNEKTSCQSAGRDTVHVRFEMPLKGGHVIEPQAVESITSASKPPYRSQKPRNCSATATSRSSSTATGSPSCSVAPRDRRGPRSSPRFHRIEHQNLRPIGPRFREAASL